MRRLLVRFDFAFDVDVDLEGRPRFFSVPLGLAVVSFLLALLGRGGEKAGLARFVAAIVVEWGFGV